MQTENATNESELTKFFTGLDAGLNSLREVRMTYDEHVAFDFNMLRFFNFGEAKVSEILAFFLDPTKEHGQKTAFLRVFLEHFNLSDNISLLLGCDEQITVKTEDRTEDKRRIDITVFFSNANFAVGIENKIYAKDQIKQVQDYCIELERRTSGNYKLLYLSPDGHKPSEESIDANVFSSLSQEILHVVSYSMIVELFAKYEAVCRADNVRAFIRQFQQHIKQEYLKESFMGETHFVIDYVRAHPEILKHYDALLNAFESLKEEFFGIFWDKLAWCLKRQNIIIDANKMKLVTRAYSCSEVEHQGSPFGESELNKPCVFYEPSHPFIIYISIDMKTAWKDLPPTLASKVEALEEKLRYSFKNLGARQSKWCADVFIPHPEFVDSKEICELLNDKDGSKMQNKVDEAANTILKYIETAESAWREM